ncbi:mitochondrial Delta-1-pyrroline-5-carboxylate dehydrogenase [Drechslerella stenobrocha 248]|uniref:Multifunctional fusion protein n=1 Tax=Drechslerella stenobrocha 248 TaxID=1043628 RepID=W7HWA7_9PEZI|nr:mitochondrial Delta-1-pyrroline-5-carboxylate dehydrogenase [Drechslerella stenobrocha 248]
MSTFATFKLPAVVNEPNQHFAKGTAERQKLQAALDVLKNKGSVDIPVVVAGKTITTDDKSTQHMPSHHAKTLATCSQATPQHVKDAIDSALAARESWSTLPFADRAAIFLKAADLIAGKYRYDILAATMLGQGKNAWQAEIDAAAECADFLRFNCAYAEELYSHQPAKNAPGVWNRVEYRPLEGFVYAITPFNFTAIAANLPCAPALLGNVVVWKPSPSAVYSNYLLYNILLEAGLPPNVIQFVPGDAEAVTETVLAHKEFASLHFTGSTAVFRHLYGKIAKGVADGTYKSYPRIVGETGGKNFHVVHGSADVKNAVINTVRGAFEYSGQKCSATSRLYVAASVWDEFKKQLIAETEALTVGPSEEFQTFIGPVIHRGSFDKLKKVIDDAKDAKSGLTLVTGGKYDDSQGFFIYPTVYQTEDPTHELFNRELFGPILTAYVYPDAEFENVLKAVDSTGGGYALTGSIFAQDREVVRFAEEKLRDAAGNFYINCKSTGAVVGQQPFGGGRASGTNDKAGSMNLLLRFVNVRSIKEEFASTESVVYASNAV